MSLLAMFRRKPQQPQADSQAAPVGHKKLTGLRKQLAKVGARGVAILGVAAAIYYGAYWWHSSLEGELKKVQQEQNKASSTLIDLQSKMQTAERLTPIFEKLRASAQPGLQEGDIPIDRIRARENLEALALKHALSAMQLSISGIKDETTGEMKNDQAQAQSCEITISAGAPSDEHVMALLQDIRDVLPGVLVVKNLSMNRGDVISPETYANMQKTGRGGAVDVKLNLVWYGIKVTPQSGTGAPPGAMP